MMLDFIGKLKYFWMRFPPMTPSIEELTEAAEVLPSSGDTCRETLAVLRCGLPVGFRHRRRRIAHNRNWKGIPPLLAQWLLAQRSLFVLTYFMPLLSDESRRYHINVVYSFAIS